MSVKKESKIKSVWTNRRDGIILCLFLILSLVSFRYFFPKIGIPSNKEKFEYGVYIANLIAPLLSLIGSALVYLAFKAQIKANKLTQSQFRHSQVAGMFESLRNNISNFAVNVGNHNEAKGYDIFKKILTELKSEQELLASDEHYSIYILASIPEIINLRYYEDFISLFEDKTHTKSELKIEAEKLKDYLILHRDVNHLYYNFDIVNINLHGDLLVNRTYFLKKISDKYFYYMGGGTKMDIYSRAFKPISKNYEIFLDSYFNQVYAILDLLFHSQGEEIDAERYIKNAFTNQEKVLLYHKLLTGTTTRELGQYLLELKVFNFTMSKEYFLPNMSEIHCNKELDYMKPLIYKTD